MSEEFRPGREPGGVSDEGASDAGRCGPGLVPSSTSGTREEKEAAAGGYRIDPVESRLKRMKRRVLTGARLHQEQQPRFKAAMLTLTYREDGEWQPRHVSELLACVRKWVERRGVRFRYVWVLELTKAGRPHYHVLIWLPRGLTLPKPGKQGWWVHGRGLLDAVPKRCPGGGWLDPLSGELFRSPFIVTFSAALGVVVKLRPAA